MDGAYVWEKRDACGALVVEFERKNHVQDLGLHGDNIKMHLKYIGCGHGLDLSISILGQLVDLRECGNEPSDSVRYWIFLTS